jgi:hypothetical protein
MASCRDQQRPDVAGALGDFAHWPSLNADSLLLIDNTRQLDAPARGCADGRYRSGAPAALNSLMMQHFVVLKALAEDRG